MKTDAQLASSNRGLWFRQPSKKVSLVLLFLMMILSTGIGLYVFSKTSLRLDEAQSLFQTNRNMAGLLRAVAQDVHVPLYHTLLYVWQKLFGGDIATVRYMSLLFFVATIPAAYLLGSYAFNRSVGLFAAFLLAISPFMNWYGSEARMYSLLALITVVHQYFFLKLLREGRAENWIGYTLTAILGIYTHYFFSFVLLTEVIFFLFMRRHFVPKKALLKFSAVAGIVAASFAPWLYYANSLGLASNTRPNLSSPSSGDLFNTYSQFLFGFQVDYLNTIIVSLWPIVVLLAFFALQQNRKVPSETIFFVLAAVVPVIGAFIISITITPFYLSRYLIVALPALLIFLSWILANYPPRLSYPLRGVLVLVVLGLFAVQIANPNTPVKEDYASAARYLNENATAQDVVIVSAPFTIYPTEYYYKGDARLVTQPQWDRFGEGSIPAFNKDTLPQETKEITGPYQTAWLVLSFDQGYQSDIKQYYDNNYERLEHKEFSPGLNVYAYKIRYDDAVTLSIIE